MHPWPSDMPPAFRISDLTGQGLGFSFEAPNGVCVAISPIWTPSYLNGINCKKCHCLGTNEKVKTPPIKSWHVTIVRYALTSEIISVKLMCSLESMKYETIRRKMDVCVRRFLCLLWLDREMLFYRCQNELKCQYAWADKWHPILKSPLNYRYKVTSHSHILSFLHISIWYLTFGAISG